MRRLEPGGSRRYYNVRYNIGFRHGRPQTYSNRQLRRRDPAEGHARAPEGRKRRHAARHRHARRPSPHASRSPLRGADETRPPHREEAPRRAARAGEVRKWVWIERSVILAAHDEQLAEHGGSSGIRDAGLLDSALARPLNRAAYGKPDTAELAAAYAYGLATNHPFVDGNKRVAFVALELFLALNEHQPVADDADCVMSILAVAAGTMKEAAFAESVRRHSKRQR